MQDWNYVKTNAFEVTIELSCEKIIDASKLKSYWNENKYALLSYMGQVIQKSQFLRMITTLNQYCICV